MDKIELLKDIIKNSTNIVFLGGAGVSTESNIPDFRSNQGIYNSKNKYNCPPEVMLSHSFFKSNTDEFFRFYKDKMIFKDAKPNLAHKALAKLEEVGKLNAIITQNIDGLHQLAGSKNVLELHGSVHRNYCMGCNKFHNLDYILKSNNNIPVCEVCGDTVKPDVVLYEESLDSDILRKSILSVSQADTFIVGGTSLVVYPAAGLLEYFKGKNLILINKEATPYDNKANLVIKDSIGKVLSEALKEL
ncbi:NAD-dependent protein deacylase [Clostridium senegalense]|uniref:NAD-dependent protein deacetylase n=1 Tax=Clostridium senegalense TaxID=1465809 RepID=A0A6M0H7Q3_9CLOT|nr:NAD-dependent protein deacylase [Clostridium senegalense]NEU06408.1 NAD-dependent protein deacylase [Clostridium senegalense]